MQKQQVMTIIRSTESLVIGGSLSFIYARQIATQKFVLGIIEEGPTPSVWEDYEKNSKRLSVSQERRCSR